MNRQDFQELSEMRLKEAQILFREKQYQGAQHKAALGDPTFSLYWSVVKDWSEQDRYDKTISRQDAEDLLRAITDPNKGLLPSVRANW